MEANEYIVHAKHPESGENKTFFFKQATNEIFLIDREKNSMMKFARAEPNQLSQRQSSVANFFEGKEISDNRYNKDNPFKKDLSKVVQLEFQVGAGCNYSCGYCSQGGTDDQNCPDPTIDETLENIRLVLDPKRTPALKELSFFGGDPIYYYRTLVKVVALAEKLRPGIVFSLVTNGSLFTDEIIQWCKDKIKNLIISHDGPGQHVRNKIDYLDNVEYRNKIIDLYHFFRENKRNMKFNPLLTPANGFDKEAISKYFIEKLGFEPRFFTTVGLDHYGPATFDHVLTDSKTAQSVARLHLHQLLNNDLSNYPRVISKLTTTEALLLRNIPVMKTTHDQCRAFEETQLTMDGHGNFVTCGNLFSNSVADNGESHCIGNVKSEEELLARNGTSALNYEKCRSCIVLSVCQGGCYFHEGELKDINCFNRFYTCFPFFAAAFFRVTGYVITTVENEHLPKHLGDVFGYFNEQYPEFSFRKKVFNIKQVS